MITLDVNFAGLCAFVPNTWTAGQTAESWSVLLVNLEKGKKQPPLAPHFAVLTYALHEFDPPGRDPDLIIKRHKQPDQGLFRLWGHRIELDLKPKKTGTFKPNDEPLSVLDKWPSDSKKRCSAKWIPSLGDLLPGAGILGTQKSLLLFDKNGRPNRSRLSAHVILRHGSLETTALAPPGVNDAASIWQFKEIVGGASPVDRAVAHASRALSGSLQSRGSLTLKTASGKPITLKQKQDIASVTIMNFELEQAIRWLDGEAVKKGEPDPDFDLMYWLAQKHKSEKRKLPYYLKADGKSGGGTRRRTCGAARFESFPHVDQGLVSSW